MNGYICRRFLIFIGSEVIKILVIFLCLSLSVACMVVKLLTIWKQFKLC